MQAIFAHTKSLSMFNLASLKPAMKKEIDEALANAPPAAPVRKQTNATAPPTSESMTVPQSQSSPVDNGIMTEELWASLPAQEPSSKICGLLKTASKRDEKWKVRKEALNAATKIVLALPHIKEGAEFYGDAYDAIKICLQDSTMWIRIAAINFTRALVIGGRKGFSTYGMRIVKTLFQWFKEKKMVHVNAINECLEAIHFCLFTLEDLYDVISENTKPTANPYVIECTLAFVSKAIATRGMSASLFSQDTPLMENLIKTITVISTQGKTPALREAGARVLQSIIDCLGRKDSRITNMMDAFKTSNKTLFKKLSGDHAASSNSDKRRPSSSRLSTGSVVGASKSARRDSSSSVSHRNSIESGNNASAKRQSVEGKSVRN